MIAHATQSSLFRLPDELPHGLAYQLDFLTADEEAELLACFPALPFREARFRAYYARRRVVSFHRASTADGYDSTADDDLAPAGPPPPLLARLRDKVVSEYQPGTPIGWHRDKPHYGIVAGVSLGSRARMRFRPLPAPGEWTRIDPRTLILLDLEPRSIYLLRGEIRWRWHHGILPTKALRYSVTMRTAARAADTALA